MDGAFDAAVGALGAARRITVLTGAGASAESGVPTFRDAQSGLWASYDPHELATPEAFEADPALVWGWYRWRRELVAKVSPNPGHYALVELAQRTEDFVLITQNVDGLHQKAGSRDVLEFHGNLFTTRCHAEGTLIRNADTDDGEVPKCPHCGGPLRPGVVWFGEELPAAAAAAAGAAARRCDVFLSVGTSSVVWPAAGLAESAANNGATVIEINPETTPLSRLGPLQVIGKSGEVLPELLNCLSV